jgi:hypothetical protein
LGKISPVIDPFGVGLEQKWVEQKQRFKPILDKGYVFLAEFLPTGREWLAAFSTPERVKTGTEESLHADLAELVI